MTKYASFGELAKHEAQGRDFRVRRIERPDSRAAILAPHGGKIEEGTSEIAASIAGADHSLFCFEGLKSYGRNRDLHITSHRFDHPDCLAMAARRDIIVSVHGCMGHSRIFVGGLDVDLSGRLSMELAAAGYVVICEGHRYPGRHPFNICNRGLRNKGAQLEITYDLRAPEHHAAIARAVRSAIADFSDSLEQPQLASAGSVSKGRIRYRSGTMSPAQDPADWIDDGARRGPHRAFLRTPEGRELNYAGLADQVARFASALAARGVGQGDRVAAQVDKSVDAILLYLACLDLGAVFVPINVANTENEVDYFLRDSGPRLAVVKPSSRALLEPVAVRAQVSHLETLGPDGEGSLPQLVRRCAGGARPARRCGGDSLAAIVYTSGTTGRAKGAMLTRGNLACNAEVLAEVWHFTENDVLLHALPLFHVHGLFAAINTVLASRSSLVLLPKFDAAAVLTHLPAATVYMGVPTHYTRLLREPGLDRAAAAGMRLFISGSAPLLAETHREFSDRTGHRIIERYGMTETLMNSSNPYDGARVPGSVGPPLPGVSIRVSNAVDGIGSFEIKGPNVFAGYWADVEKTRAEFTADGWFKTGDVGRIEDSYLYIVGRAKDLVISGGYNVYPKEVETELDALPGVLESAVFGVPHPDFGEGVTAAVVREPGTAVSEADLVRAVKTRLAAYKIPKRILFIDDLPRNAMGKVQKNTLRSTYAALYVGQ